MSNHEVEAPPEESKPSEQDDYQDAQYVVGRYGIKSGWSNLATIVAGFEEREARRRAVSTSKLLLHCPRGIALSLGVLAAVEEIDPHAQIKRDWDSVLEDLDAETMNAIDVVIDVFGHNARVGLEHLQELWNRTVTHNYSPVPLYFALSYTTQPASLRYEIRRLGGRFMYASDVPRHLHSELEEIRLQLDEVRKGLPQWEIIQENFGLDPQRAYVQIRFAGRVARLMGSDRHHAVLAVVLKNNGIPRTMRTLRQLCSEDSLFAPAGGPFAVPRLATLKMHIYRDFPEYMQRAFDAVRSGHRVERVIEHIDLGAKPMGFRIRGDWKITMR